MFKILQFFSILNNSIWIIEKFKWWKFTKLKMSLNSTSHLVINYQDWSNPFFTILKLNYPNCFSRIAKLESIIWVPSCCVSLCWVSLCWVSLCCVSWHLIFKEIKMESLKNWLPRVVSVAPSWRLGLSRSEKRNNNIISKIKTF